MTADAWITVTVVGSTAAALAATRIAPDPSRIGRMGVPSNVLLAVVNVLIAPWIWPF